MTLDLDIPTVLLTDGACRAPGIDPSIFFPDTEYDSAFAAARAICATCPVADTCLDHALRRGERGIWGGTNENQRRKMRKTRGISLLDGRRAQAINHGTEGGSRAHRRRGEAPCPSCADAERAAHNERVAARKAVAS